MLKEDKSRIHSPRRLLILAPSDESHVTIPPFLRGLTGVAVPLEALEQQQLAVQSPGVTSKLADGTATDVVTPPSVFAGYTTHAPLQLNTRYYNADIPIWADELPVSSSQTSPSSPSSSSSPPPSSPAVWKDDFLSPEALEVREAIGAIIVCVQKPTLAIFDNSATAVLEPGEKKEMEDAFEKSIDGIRDVVRAVAEVKSRIEEERGGGIGDVPGLAILIGKDEGDEAGGRLGDGEDDAAASVAGGSEFGDVWWDEQLNDGGRVSMMEITSWDPREGRAGFDFNAIKGRRNDFGELVGMERIKQVLEANEWSSGSDVEFDDSDASDAGIGKPGGYTAGGMSLDADELEREMTGLRLAINKGNNDDGGDDDDDGSSRNHDEGNDGVGNDDFKVEQLEGIMLRVQAIRDMGHDLPEAERKSFAKKAINDLMKEL